MAAWNVAAVAVVFGVVRAAVARTFGKHQSQSQQWRSSQWNVCFPREHREYAHKIYGWQVRDGNKPEMEDSTRSGARGENRKSQSGHF